MDLKTVHLVLKEDPGNVWVEGVFSTREKALEFIGKAKQSFIREEWVLDADEALPSEYENVVET